MNTDANRAAYVLQTWFSPSFPVGAYTYSHGLENAFDSGRIETLEQAIDWISDIVSLGNGFADAVFLSQCHHAVEANDSARLAAITAYARAFAGTEEFRLESEAQGGAYIKTVTAIDRNPGLYLLTQSASGPYPYAVAVGSAAAGAKLDSILTTTAYLHALVANLSSALVRLVPFGQTDGQRIIHALADQVQRVANEADKIDYQEVSTSTMMVDLTSIHHETQYTRIFRS